jgi:mannosyltransferase
MDERVNLFVRNVEEKPVYQYVTLAVIVLLATMLRFYKLGEWSMWIDEIYTINRAQIHFNDPVRLLQSLPSTLWLPLSVIFTNIALNIFGVTEWSARLAPALFAIVSIPLLYFPVRRMLGVGTALVFSLLLALASWHLFWSQNARFYSSLMLLYALAAFLFYLAFEHDRPWYFIPFYILFYFALSERLIAGFLLPGLFIYLGCSWIFRFDHPRGLTARNLIFFLIPIFLMIAFEVVRYLFTGSSTVTFFISDFGNKQVEDPFRLLISIIYNIGFPVFALGLFAGVYLLLKKDRLGLFLLMSALLPILLLMVMNQFMFTKDRYAFMTLTFWLLLSAIAIWELVKQMNGIGKFLALGLLVVLIADASGKNVQYYLVNHGNRRDWRAAFQIIQDKGQPDDIVVAWWPEFGPLYLEREILPTEQVTPELVLEAGKRSWFIIDSETVWGNVRLRDFLEENAQLIDILYLRLPEDDFNIKIYLYDPAVNAPKP